MGIKALCHQLAINIHHVWKVLFSVLIFNFLYTFSNLFFQHHSMLRSVLI